MISSGVSGLEIKFIAGGIIRRNRSGLLLMSNSFITGFLMVMTACTVE